MKAPLSPLLQRFEAHLAYARWLSPHSVRNYLVDARYLEVWLTELGLSLETATRNDLKAYLAELRGELAPASRARRLMAIKELYRFLVRCHVVPASPAEHLVERFAATRRTRTWLTVTDVSSVLDAPTTPSVLRLRNRAILELLYGGGLRSAELSSLNLGDIDVSQRMARVMGKGNKERLCPLNAGAVRALEEYLKLRPQLCRRADADSQRAMFLNHLGGRLGRQAVYTCVRRAFAALGKEVSPHTLRHAYASHLLHRGAKITEVQELLGHANVRTTQRYTEATPEFLEAEYRRTHPRA